MNTKKEIITKYIALVEKIATGKTNVLDFGTDGMIFYRGEIHILKFIGDFPGTFSSEIARHMNVTRAVVYKILVKLEKRGLVRKEETADDGKIKKLFLTDKGKTAYKLHEEYHQKHDKDFFDYINALNEEEEEIVLRFLKKSMTMISRHF